VWRSKGDPAKRGGTISMIQCFISERPESGKKKKLSSLNLGANESDLESSGLQKIVLGHVRKKNEGVSFWVSLRGCGTAKKKKKTSVFYTSTRIGCIHVQKGTGGPIEIYPCRMTGVRLGTLCGGREERESKCSGRYQKVLGTSSEPSQGGAVDQTCKSWVWRDLGYF